jgi:hypothetical protein
MHAEPINDLLVKENVPGDDRVNTFDEWAAYTRSNAIVSSTLLYPPSHRRSKHNSLILPFSLHSRLSIQLERPRSHQSTYVVGTRNIWFP